MEITQKSVPSNAMPRGLELVAMVASAVIVGKLDCEPGADARDGLGIAKPSPMLGRLGTPLGPATIGTMGAVKPVELPASKIRSGSGLADRAANALVASVTAGTTNAKSASGRAVPVGAFGTGMVVKTSSTLGSWTPVATPGSTNCGML